MVAKIYNHQAEELAGGPARLWPVVIEDRCGQ